MYVLMKKWISRFVAVGLVLGSAASPGAADTPTTALLDGRVIDAAGAPLPDVAVMLESPRGEREARTDVDGVFLFPQLLPGEYVVSARGEAGEAALLVALETGIRRRVELVLAPTAGEEIDVVSEAASVHLYENGLVSKMDVEIYENLSFKGRNYQASLEALPGVVQSARSRTTAEIQPSVNGGQWQENAGFVDGVDTSFSRRGGSSRMLLPSSALQEVRIESGGFGAEHGRVVAGVTSAVVKAGSNDLHGDILYLPQNQKWRSAYEALDIPRDDEIINSYEISLGGPLLRDRLWFFLSAASIDTNEIDLLANGDVEAVGIENTPRLLKLNGRLGERHSWSLVGIDSPIDKVQINQQSGDEFSPCLCTLNSELASFSWNTMLSERTFFEAKIAMQENTTDRQALRLRPIDPSSPADWPTGNQFQYVDRNNNRRYNAIGQTAGLGFQTMPRDQINASISRLQGRHEFNVGIDFQDLEMQSFNFLGRQFQGRGWNPAAPGGFATPEFMRVFDPSQTSTNAAEILSAFVQDRISGERWTLSFGLRVDDQDQTNDIGETATSSTDLAPRLSFAWDLGAGRDVPGRLLLKAGAGRYYQVFSQDLANRELARLPNGLNIFDEFGWNPETQSYDRFLRRSVPALDTAIQAIDPYYKDEITLGLEWQPGDAWVLKGGLVAWELDDLFWSSDQFDENGQIVRDIRNWDDGFRKYRGAYLEANRTLRGGWALRANYAWGENEGNMFGANSGRLDDDDLFEGLGGIEQGTGSTDATVINRTGRGDSDRTHNFNLAATKHWTLGRHHLALGGYFGFRSGERWGRRVNTNVRHPISGRTIRTTTYREARDAQQLEDTWTMNLTASWVLPISERFRTRLGIEAVNVTDEQELIGVNIANGRALPGITAYQSPREIRFELGLSF